VETFDVIIRPLVTEKLSNLTEKQNQYGFVVSSEANKIEIKRAIEMKFGVKVKSVRTVNVLGKVKTLGRFSGRRSNWKKAIVSLESGQKITLFEGA
jgi:large subunit ribosomal protein L23